MTTVIEAVGPEGQVGAGGYFPHSIKLTSGNYVVTWLDRIGDNDTLVQVFNSAGVAVGTPYSITAAQAYDAVAPLTSGGFVVLYTTTDQAIAQIFDAAGSPVGEAVPLGAIDYNSQAAIDVATLSSGGFAASWRNGSNVTVKTYDGAGSAVATIVADIGQGAASPKILQLTNGKLALVWEEYDTETPQSGGNPDGYQVSAQIFATDGTAVGAKFIVNDSQAGTHGSPEITALADGGFVVTWVAYGSDAGVKGQLYDATGAAVGSNFQVSDGVPGYQELAHDVAALPWGGFFVTWADRSPNNPQDLNAGIRAQLFDASGARVGDAIQVNAQRFGNEVTPSVLIVSDTEARIFYRASDGEGASGVLERSILLPTVGTSGNDVLNGTSGNDRIVGLDGDDTIHGAAGDDALAGAGGNDTLDGDSGADTMAGGLGNDRYYIDDAFDRPIEFANEGDDIAFVLGTYRLEQGISIETLYALDQASTDPLVLTGNEYGQSLYGNQGDNYLNGGQGDDYLVGLGGNDNLLGGTGADHMAGGTGNDVYYVDEAGDLITELAGEGDNDILVATDSYTLAAGVSIETMSAEQSIANINLTGNELAQSIYGNAGDNILTGGGGADYLVGGAGNDRYYVDTSDYIAEEIGGGDDWIFVATSYTLREGNEIETLVAVDQDSLAQVDFSGNEFGQSLYGSQGINHLNGGGGDDYLVGLGGDDVLIGGDGADTMDGGQGNDIFYVTEADDVIFERTGEGDDLVVAFTSYVLTAGTYVETLAAAEGTAAIDLTGNARAQSVYGNAGSNVLNGGAGSDYLSGGSGADSFDFTTALGTGNVDTIADFSVADDTIRLEDAVFTGLATGALNANALVIGAGAQDADDRIVYDSATGALYFDADGNGAGAAIQFATLQAGLSLTAADFFVI